MPSIPLPRRGCRARVVPVVLVFAFTPGSARAGAADSARAFWARGQQDSAHAWLDSAIADARGRGAEDLRELLRLQGAMYSAVGFADPSLPFLEEALELDEARGDSTAMAKTLRWLVAARSQRRELEEAERLARRQRTCAEAMDLPLERARAMASLGWIAMERNQLEEARATFERVLADLGKVDDQDARRQEGLATVRLGNALLLQGRYEEARAALERACALSERTGNLWSLGMAQNDLGFLAWYFGDLDEAASRFEAAADTQKRDGNARAAVGPILNRALLDAERGRYDDARARMRDCATFCEEEGFDAEAAVAWKQLAETRLSIGDAPGALDEFRHALTKTGEGALPLQADILGGMTSAYLATGDRSAADSLVAVNDPALGDLPGVEGLEWTRAAAHVRRLAGDPGAAAAALFPAVGRAREAGFARTEWRLLRELALCSADQGDRGSALRRFAEAADAWESERRTPRDPSWDEQATADAHALFEDWIDTILQGAADPAAAAQAWSVLRRYKARTLLERMAGPAWATDGSTEAPAGGERPEDVLDEGETLVDLLVGAGRGFVFAVNADGVRVASRDSAEVRAFGNACREIAADLERGNDIAPEAVEALRRFLGDAVIPPGAVRILSPDGPAHRVPWEAVALGDGTPLAAFRVPSFEFLARVRSRTRDGAAGSGVTVLEGRSLPDGTGLRGAHREAVRLRRLLADVQVRTGADSEALTTAPPRVLHVAAHAVADDAVPWRSGIFLPGEDGADRWLRAGEVSRVRIPADLVVLSGCDTAGGAVVSGEGVLGLATAFLAAGTPVVIATLGGVDDRALPDAIMRVYEELLRGRTVASAVLAARRGARGEEADALGRIVVIGDGARGVELRRRRPAWVPMIGVLLVVGLTAGAFLRRRERAL